MAAMGEVLWKYSGVGYSIEFQRDEEGGIWAECRSESDAGTIYKVTGISRKFFDDFRSRGYIPYLSEGSIGWRTGERPVRHYFIKGSSFHCSQVNQKAVEGGDAYSSRSAGLALLHAKEMYESSDPQERLSALFYILQYQHYNAEFNISENHRLQYPQPFCVRQEKHGYVRSEYRQLFSMIELWLKSAYPQLKIFAKKNEGPFGKLKLTTMSMISALSSLYSLSMSSLKDCSEWVLQNKQAPPTEDKKYIFLEISLDDLSKDFSELVKAQLKKFCGNELKISSIKAKFPNARFLFMMPLSKESCLAFGAQWSTLKIESNVKLFHQSLDAFFGEEVFSNLTIVGAAADRLAINHFLANQLKKKNWSEILQICGISEEALSSSESVSWKESLAIAERASLEKDPGSKLYRDAVLTWNDCFFKEYDLLPFASSLLRTQVGSWIRDEGGIVDWAKAYQNMNEIVMLCLQRFPEKYRELRLEDVVLRALPASYQEPQFHRSVGLFSYGMSAFFFIFTHILQREEFSGRKVNVASISQNYFEILGVQQQLHQGQVIFEQKDLIDQFEEMPDILVADIHPNNAARKKLFQNDVAGWMSQKLTNSPDKRAVLVLDLTLNQLSDKEVFETLEKLRAFVENGQLEIFVLQSLAKLMQMGADNFSGGLCLYLGRQIEGKSYPAFPAPFQEKEQFFTLLHLHFSKLIERYFEQVRSNTDEVFGLLQHHLEGFSKIVHIVPNPDSKTVYISLNFSPLLETDMIQEDRKEKFVNDLRKDLLDLAAERNLPLTGRQSFGFSLSNMSSVRDSIRFSIGVDRSYQLQYVQLIHQYVAALYKSTSQEKVPFDWGKYTADVHAANDWFTEKEEYSGEKIELIVEEVDAFGHDTYTKVGEAEILYKNQELTLKLQRENAREPEIVSVSQISLGDFGEKLTESDLFALFFHLRYSESCSEKDPEPDKLYLRDRGDGYVLEGLARRGWNFRWDQEVIDKDSNIQLKFDPFSLQLPDGRVFASQQVFVIHEAFGSAPGRLDRLGQSASEIYNRCLQYDIHTTDCEGGIFLAFGERKKNINYEKHLFSLYREGGFSPVLRFLNQTEEELHALAQVHDLHWGMPIQPRARIGDILDHSLPGFLFRHWNGQLLADILEIQNHSWKNMLIQGLYRSLLGNIWREPNHEAISDLQKFFIEKKRPFEYELTEEWMKEAIEMAQDGQIVQKFDLTLAILVPIWEQYFNSLGIFHHLSLVRDLREMADKYQAVGHGFMLLKEWLTRLEEKLIENAALEQKRPRSFSFYLQCLFRYPFSEEQKERLVNALQCTSEESLREWLLNPDCYFDFLSDDAFFYELHGGDPEDIIFYERDQPEIQRIFSLLGCERFFSKLGEEHKHVVSRWKRIMERN